MECRIFDLFSRNNIQWEERARPLVNQVWQSYCIDEMIQVSMEKSLFAKTKVLGLVIAV